MSIINLPGIVDFFRNTFASVANLGTDIETRYVDSTCLSKVEYDDALQALTVVFEKSGSTYQYYNVPKTVYQDLITASSVGQTYIIDVKSGGYNYARIY
jgi:hypothetical protein